MADYYKLVGHKQSTTNWTTEVVLEVDDAGEPTKVARVGEPGSFSQQDRDKLESLGFVVEKSSASEAKEVEESKAQTPGSDIVGAGPVLGAVTTDQDNESGSKSRK